MSNFDYQTFTNLQKLCRIQCTSAEEAEILRSLTQILEYVAQMNEVDTNGTPPCNYVLKEMANTVLREDIIGDLLPRELFLANAPDQTGGMVRVPPVIKP
jgi:aspartyl-tRNA(Asn)/glutamyl-tRNA(Gln) amidotransferase subunit C